jgi:phage-related minor tail protein
MRAGEVEVLLTVDDNDLARAEKNVKATGQRIEKKPITQKVDADPADALAGMDRVEEQAKRIVSSEVVARVDANIEKGEKNLARIQGNLDYLRSVSTELDVSADIRRAEANLRRVEGNLNGLRGARATMEVDADTSSAEAALDEVADSAEEAGGDGGRRGGAALVSGIVAGLASIPIAGAVAKIGHTAADVLINEFQSALQIEVRQDRLEGLTGISEDSAARFARVAGEAYANNFGESIESNMNTTRLALQFDLIDEDATTRDAQKVVEGLGGIADVLDEDVTRSATAVSVLLSSGMANSALRAYDLLATGAREGLNRNEDLLDTLTEYPVVLRRLGLTGEEMLGLLNQGLESGARNTDVVADALKEFQIRATDASTLSAAGFERLGFSAEEMTAKIASGGTGAREGLQQVLDKLRETEDPVVRNAAAVELFGTKAEDLGAALFSLDLTSAVDQLNGVQGAADRMFSTLADNDSSRIAQAQRNIEIAAEGIKGALASAFSEPLGDVAEWVSQNRGPVLQFFLDLANGALDFGESVVESAAAGTEAFGSFVAGPLADTVDGIAALIDAVNGFEGRPAELDKLRDSMRGFDEQTDIAADTMRENLGSALDEARGKLNEFGEPAVAMGFLNDASLRLATAIDGVGYSADGSRLLLEGFDASNARASESGALLEDQVRGAIAALSEEVSAAQAAGESQEALTGRYQSATSALQSQLEAMGLTEDQARALIDTVLQTPPSATTAYSSNATDEQAKVQNLATRVETLPDGTIVINADASPAQRAIDAIKLALSTVANTFANLGSGRIGSGGTFPGRAWGGPIFGAGGPRDDLVPIMASNGEHMLTAAEVDAAGGHAGVFRLRQALLSGVLRLADGGPVVPASTWRTDVPAMAAPIVVSAGAAPRQQSGPLVQVVDNATYFAFDPRDIERQRDEKLRRAVQSLPKR